MSSKWGSAKITLPKTFLLWLLFLLICLGLGYATLNRYDPSTVAGLADTVQYARMVDQSTPAAGLWSYRILVPYLARPVYHLVHGHIGAWSSVFFALLVINGLFVATTALLVFRIGQTVLPRQSTALIGVLLYLLSFNVVNAQLVGLVDSGEALFLTLMIWALLYDRWHILPVLGILGALTKETFVPIATVSALGWWVVDYRKHPNSLYKIAWVISMGVVGLMTISGIRWILGEGPFLPFDIAAVEKGQWQGFFFPLDRTFLYAFVWLLPLAVLRLHDFPPSWIVASTAGFFVILLLVVWQPTAINSLPRAAFNLMGGLLSLATAAFLESMMGQSDPNKRNAVSE